MEIIKLLGEIDYNKKVRVYRNLHYRDKVIYSVKQNNKVIAHVSTITLVNVSFKVNQRGVDRIRAKKQKEVVAFLEGTISNDSFPQIFRITFNPYEYYYFNINGVKVDDANYAIFNDKGVFIN